MNINIYFMRHGFSCANAISKYASYIYQWKQLMYLDPPLTQHSKEDISKHRGEFPQNIDIVGSSVLLRAIETALLSYPSKKVIPFPFISELGIGLSQRPSSPEIQREVLGKRLSKRVNYTFVTPINNSNIFLPNVGHPSYVKFLEYLGENLPDIIQAAGVDIKPGKKELNILIVTHSLFMADNFGFKETLLPKNNAIILKRYMYNPRYRHLREKPCTRKSKSFFKVDDDLQCGGVVHTGLSYPSTKEQYLRKNGHVGCKYRDIF